MKQYLYFGVIYLIFLILLTSCAGTEDGENKVEYHYNNRKYVTRVSHNNPAIPQDFEEYKSYDSDAGVYSIHWTIEKGGQTQSCSNDYTISEVQSGAVCSGAFSFDDIFRNQECAEKQTTKVHFGAGETFLGIPLFHCYFNVRSEK